VKVSGYPDISTGNTDGDEQIEVNSLPFFAPAGLSQLTPFSALAYFASAAPLIVNAFGRIHIMPCLPSHPMAVRRRF
jgi:hypothetical protein